MLTPGPVRLRFAEGKPPKTTGHFYLRALQTPEEWRLSVWDPLLRVHNTHDGTGYSTAMSLFLATLESFADAMWSIQQTQRQRFLDHWRRNGRPTKIVNPGFKPTTTDQLWRRLMGEQAGCRNEYGRLCSKAINDSADWPGDKLLRLPWQLNNGLQAPWAKEA